MPTVVGILTFMSRKNVMLNHVIKSSSYCEKQVQVLILEMQQMRMAKLAHNVDPETAAYNELPHVSLHYLLYSL